MVNEIQSPQTLENPQGHPQAASAAGQAQPSVPSEFDIGAFNGVKVNPSEVIAQHRTQAKGTETTQQTQTVTDQKADEGKQVATRQLTEKDERHFAKFVTQASQEKYDLAKLAVETDKDNIFKIAETDQELAKRLLKEYDYGTEDVEELLNQQVVTKSKNPEEVQKEIEDTKWKKDMEKQLMEEKILRLKGENPDLTGEVEDKFREIYSNPAMKDYDVDQKIAVARAIVGKSTPQSNANDVALAILQREEGIVSSPRATSATEKTRQISPEMRKMMQSANLSEKDLGVLPDNINDLINQMYGPLVGQ